MYQRSHRCRGIAGLGLSAVIVALLAGCTPGAQPAPAAGPATPSAKPANATTAVAQPVAGTALPSTPAAGSAAGGAASTAPSPATIAAPKSPTPAVPPTIVHGVQDTNVLVSVQLVRVIDGATIEVSIKGKNFVVRYLGIEPPAGGANPGAWEAGALAGNKKLLAGQALRLEKDVTDTDSEGRLLRYVYTKTSMVNAEMVRFGYARTQSQEPDTRYHFLFDAMQEEAKAAKRGLWASNP